MAYGKDRKLSSKIDYFSRRNTYGIKKGSKTINIDCWDGKTRRIANTLENRKKITAVKGKPDRYKGVTIWW